MSDGEEDQLVRQLTAQFDAIAAELPIRADGRTVITARVRRRQQRRRVAWCSVAAVLVLFAAVGVTVNRSRRSDLPPPVATTPVVTGDGSAWLPGDGYTWYLSGWYGPGTYNLLAHANGDDNRWYNITVHPVLGPTDTSTTSTTAPNFVAVTATPRGYDTPLTWTGSTDAGDGVMLTTTVADRWSLTVGTGTPLAPDGADPVAEATQFIESLTPTDQDTLHDLARQLCPADIWLVAPDGTTFNSIVKAEQPTPRVTLILGLEAPDGRRGRIQLAASPVTPDDGPLGGATSITVRGRPAALTEAQPGDTNGNWNALEWDEAGVRYRVAFTNDTSVTDTVAILDGLTHPDAAQIDQLMFGVTR